MGRSETKIEMKRKLIKVRWCSSRRRIEATAVDDGRQKAGGVYGARTVSNNDRGVQPDQP